MSQPSAYESSTRVIGPLIVDGAATLCAEGALLARMDLMSSNFDLEPPLAASSAIATLTCRGKVGSCQLDFGSLRGHKLPNLKSSGLRNEDSSGSARTTDVIRYLEAEAVTVGNFTGYGQAQASPFDISGSSSIKPII